MFFSHLRLLTAEFTYNYMKNIGRGARSVRRSAGGALANGRKSDFSPADFGT